MKKNFLKVAALLIAAMLLVVSCSQEVAPKNEDNGLVDAKLNIAYGRDLLVSGDSKAEDFYLEYTTKILWSDGSADDGYTEGVVGAVAAGKKLEADGKLGWLTPGYWEITVNAYERDGSGNRKGSIIFTGTTNAYFSSKINKATVFLAPVKSANNSIEFDFFMQDLGAYDTDFVVKYSISKNGESFASNVKFNKTSDANNEVFSVNDGKGHQSEYKKKVTGLSSGYYTVTVAVYEVKEGRENLKGGVTKGMLLAGNEAKVSGHIQPSDYVGSFVNAYFIDVDTELTASTPVYTANSAKVVFSLSDNTKTGLYGVGLNDISKSYIWSFDGKVSNPENVASDQEKTYDAPGDKNVSCTTIYSYTVSEKEKYFWADTQSVQVKIEAKDSFGYTYQ